MKTLHIKYHIAPPKHSKEQRLDFIRNHVLNSRLNSIKSAIKTNCNKFNFLLSVFFQHYRFLVKDFSEIYELTQDKSDWEAVL
ncbi:hypothetical protein, partial [Alteromonas sp. ASW11-130]|uniref:hypothetical protein n=1 Tax=Alteromonas sp. ASW11-130 TaxID=3015775 RepID=UPI002241B11E